MIIQKKIRHLFLPIFGGLFLYTWVITYFIYTGWVFYGYSYENYFKDNFHFIKDGQIVIPGTIVDFDWHDGYLVGLRLEVDSLICNGGSYALRVTDEKSYFILDAKNEKLLNFSHLERFSQKLEELDIGENIKLNFSRNNKVLSYYLPGYEKSDFTGCVTLLGY